MTREGEGGIMTKKNGDIVAWMTVKGNHIPIRRGQSREKAMLEFLKEADNKKPFATPDRIVLPDETLPRSLGARWANHEISMPDGTKAKFQEGSKLHHKEVFAGEGTKNPIRDVDRLVKQYPGSKAEAWRKVKAHAVIVWKNEPMQAEVHWYEESSVGKQEIKFKKEL